MTDDWRTRLKKAIKDDGRSKSAISVAAGRGRNFIQQTLDSRNPSIENLITVLRQLQPRAAYYVLTGIETAPEDIEFMRLLASLDPEAKRRALEFFRTLPKASASDGAPRPLPPDSGEPTP